MDNLRFDNLFAGFIAGLLCALGGALKDAPPGWGDALQFTTLAILLFFAIKEHNSSR